MRQRARFGRALAVSIAIACSGCSPSSRPMKFDTVTKLEDQPRSPPAVAPDLPSELPERQAQAHVDQGIVVLQGTPGQSAVQRIVREFFESIQSGEPEALENLMLPEAIFENPKLGEQHSARTFWRTRLSRLDYTRLSATLVYDPHSVETHRSDSSRLRPAARSWLQGLEASDQLVIVPIRITHEGKTQLFGEEIWLGVRGFGDQFRITRIAEDFRFP